MTENPPITRIRRSRGGEVEHQVDATYALVHVDGKRMSAINANEQLVTEPFVVLRVKQMWQPHASL